MFKSSHFFYLLNLCQKGQFLDLHALIETIQAYTHMAALYTNIMEKKRKQKHTCGHIPQVVPLPGVTRCCRLHGPRNVCTVISFHYIPGNLINISFISVFAELILTIVIFCWLRRSIFLMKRCQGNELCSITA